MINVGWPWGKMIGDMRRFYGYVFNAVYYVYNVCKYKILSACRQYSFLLYIIGVFEKFSSKNYQIVFLE